MNHKNFPDDHAEIAFLFDKASEEATFAMEDVIEKAQDEAYRVGFRRGAQISRTWIERAKKLIEHAESSGAFSSLSGINEPVAETVDNLLSDYEDLPPCEPEAKPQPAPTSAN